MVPTELDATLSGVHLCLQGRLETMVSTIVHGRV
jgi:hypothetical protein